MGIDDKGQVDEGSLMAFAMPPKTWLHKLIDRSEHLTKLFRMVRKASYESSID
jgi:hypothetical protein